MGEKIKHTDKRTVRLKFRKRLDPLEIIPAAIPSHDKIVLCCRDKEEKE